MEVKEAVRIAKAYIADLFADEQISQIGLEEVEFDESDKAWRVTIGFGRPWRKPTERKGPLANFSTYDYSDRWYKLVSIRDADEKVMFVRDRELEHAA